MYAKAANSNKRKIARNDCEQQATPAPALRSNNRRLSLDPTRLLGFRSAAIATRFANALLTVEETSSFNADDDELVNQAHILSLAVKLAVSQKMSKIRADIDSKLSVLAKMKMERTLQIQHLQNKKRTIELLSSSSVTGVCGSTILSSLSGSREREQDWQDINENVVKVLNRLPCQKLKPVTLGTDLDKICEKADLLNNTVSASVEEHGDISGTRNALEELNTLGSKLRVEHESLEHMQNEAYFMLHQEALLENN